MEITSTLCRKIIPTARSWFCKISFARIVKKTVFSKDARIREKRKADPKKRGRFLDSDKHKTSPF